MKDAADGREAVVEKMNAEKLETGSPSREREQADRTRDKKTCVLW